MGEGGGGYFENELRLNSKHHLWPSINILKNNSVLYEFMSSGTVHELINA